MNITLSPCPSPASGRGVFAPSPRLRGEGWGEGAERPHAFR
jgi:hypothetical protein